MEIPIPLLILFAGVYLLNLLAFAYWLGKLSMRVTELEKRDCRFYEMEKKLDAIAIDVAVIKQRMTYVEGLGG
jgi:uncharacterized membrane protein YfbV (UPF0208 family)